jgi:hypothetical protein
LYLSNLPGEATFVLSVEDMEITTADQEIANDDYDLMIRMASKLLTDF